MSRIGKKIITIPAGVKVNFAAHVVNVEGPKGKLTTTITSAVDLVIGDKTVECKFKGNEEQDALYGMTRTLVTNMIQGCSEGFKKVLEINGVGFRAQVKGQVLELTLGFSHPINYNIPTGVTATVEKQTILTIAGANKQLVGQVAAEIRSLRKPEPYKGKGVKYQDEVIKRKAGKSAAAA